jgi:hypothetical protein
VRDCVSVCVRACVRARVREPVFGVCVCAWLTCSLRSFPAECGPKCDNRPAAERATVGLTGEPFESPLPTSLKLWHE